MRRTICMILAGTLLGHSAAWADAESRGKMVGECLLAAARLHRLPPAILLVLLNVEGGRLGEVSGNKNKTVDIGPMQVNEIWIGKLAARWGASKEATYLALRDEFCANVEGGAWILRQALDEARGDFWGGVAIYHSHKEEHQANYLRKVLDHALRLEKRASRQRLAASGGRETK